MLKVFRYFLFPFSLLYSSIIWVRNFLYDKNIFKSATFNFPIICIGNLATGGTGKTPMTELLIVAFQHKYRLATLSRGYKRKTKGFAIANENSTALEIGDEPMQFHTKFTDVVVAVGEERLEAIPLLLQAKPTTEVIILDDAFQHRSVTAGLNILLTTQKELFTKDKMLPVGNLRDEVKSSKRAQIIIVTKCDENITKDQQEEIKNEIRNNENQAIFFTEIIYKNPYHLFTHKPIFIKKEMDVLLVVGIANPFTIHQYLTNHVASVQKLQYQDHHIFHSEDLTNIITRFNEIKSENKLIVTTEKDAIRLQKFKKELAEFPIYVLPIQHEFLNNDADDFLQIVQHFISSFNIDK
jgi:tetraacyldisaccharide 4'-kinase